MRHSIAAHYLEIKGIGITNIPTNGPLIIASNHPNSFLDAILLAVYINRPLHFLARSDVFSNKWADFILRKMNLIPIYRIQEGQENLVKNQDTFCECAKILENDGAILIFAEGISIIDRKIRPLKKGLPRIAFDFLEQTNFRKKLQVATVSLNYDRPTCFRSKVIIGVGSVIEVNKLEEGYKDNRNRAYTDLNKFIFEELKNHTIEVEDEDELVYKTLTELDSCYRENSLSRKIRIAQHINEVKEKEQEEFKRLYAYAHQAHSLLKKFHLNFRKLKANHGIQPGKVLMLLLYFPVALLGLVLNGPPYLLALWISNKTVKPIEFYASVRLVVGTLLWLLWIMTLTLLLVQIHWLFILFPLTAYPLMYYQLRFFEYLKYDLASFYLFKLKKKTAEYEELQSLIKSIYRLRTSLGLSPKSEV
jgi:1-acyl-sn-glycerol-3-phosphate acyltransferase